MDVRFFASADLLACGIEYVSLLVRVQSEIVQTTVGEPVAVV